MLQLPCDYLTIQTSDPSKSIKFHVKTYKWPNYYPRVKILLFLTLKFRFSNAAVVAFLDEIHTKTQQKFFLQNSRKTQEHFRFDEKNHVSQFIVVIFFCSLSLSSFATEIELSERARLMCCCWGGGAEQIGLSTAGAQVPTCSWDCGYNWEEKPACDKPASQPKISAKKWSANQSPQPIKKKPHSKKY